MSQHQHPRKSVQWLKKLILGHDSRSALAIYWDIYGRSDQLVRSRYLWLAFLLSVLLHPLWLKDDDGNRFWMEPALFILPSLLAFSLGGMAILLSSSNKRYSNAIRAGGTPNSLFMETIAAFFHFIFLQTVGIFVTLVVIAYDYDMISWVGFIIFSYAILTGVGVASFLLHLSSIFNASIDLDEH